MRDPKEVERQGVLEVLQSLGAALVVLREGMAVGCESKRLRCGGEGLTLG